MRFLSSLAVLSVFCLPCAAQVASAPEGDKGPAFSVKSPVPVYHALEKDLGKYYLYADGGFHADWYVGYNNCWVVKLPPVTAAPFARAFIGAKLGRSKIMSWPMAWDPRPIPGKIYLAINSEPVFNSENMYFLVDAADIPREPLPNDHLEGVDSARWFWTEIPLSRLSIEKPSYMALWSSSRYFIASSSSPIVAAAKSDSTEEDVWLSRSVKGNPPSGDGVFDIPVSGLKPAIAVKLIPANEYKVFIKGFMAELDARSITASFAVVGEDIRAAWLEVSYDKFDWQRVTRYMFKAPYFWSFGREEISRDMFYLRAAAVDNLENTGYSKEVVVPAAGRAPVVQE
ncbi:MAG: hypothetical protein A2234_09595 [Elusimicrobia bacterium RIFOXYA2_FULL_58_8]|nr:MAG: hypothetical protein A2285_06880 [Elusimicrobia bacterium RIFOXYA12_FULL_57_11]OGS14046.1 MAG: hypothetical protein A2234_09595 [Elusimicrobia bacterium RIFOXYA2_FULL_58_8]